MDTIAIASRDEALAAESALWDALGICTIDDAVFASLSDEIVSDDTRFYSVVCEMTGWMLGGRNEI